MRNDIALNCYPKFRNLHSAPSLRLWLALLASVTILAGCKSDIRSTEEEPDTSPITIVPDPVVPDQNESPTVQLASADTLTLVEGEGILTVPITVTRGDGNNRAIRLSAVGAVASDEQNLSWEFEQPLLLTTQTSTNLSVQLAIGPRPIQPHTRTLLISANDGVSDAISTRLDITIEPTDKPDIYIIAGQSNAVGNSENGAKQALAGGPDEPNDRIRQLNVTGNDAVNFATAEDFTSEQNLYNLGSPFTPALDPLHQGYDFSINGKEGDYIGFGLSFAKQALADTTAVIYLVPTAWSGTGFCTRTTNRIPGETGWNATKKDNPVLSGTLLHDRAVERANITIELTGGILRGILWHQGEADSDKPKDGAESCAIFYEDNLIELASSLRTTIDVDARGPQARVLNSDIPFVVGTMSTAEEFRDFGLEKEIVDAAHRNVGSTIPTAGVVDNIDFIPPSYPCGKGSCIHFGSAALREMGVRYYDVLSNLLPQN